MTVVEDTAAEPQTEAQKAAAAVADPRNPQDQWKQNVESVLKSLASFIPFRHEGEFNRIVIALDNLHEDIKDVLTSKEPVAPSIGQPDPVLQALVAKNAELESKLDQVLTALSNSSVVQGAATAKAPAPIENAPVVSESFPPGWTKDEQGNWVQIAPEGSTTA